MMPVSVFDVAILDDCNDSFANASDVFFLWDRVVSFIQWSFLCGWGNILLKSVWNGLSDLARLGVILAIFARVRQEISVFVRYERKKVAQKLGFRSKI